MSDEEDAKTESLQQQVLEMQQLLTSQTKFLLQQRRAPGADIPQSSTLTNTSRDMVKNVKVPEGRYSMSHAEYRTFRKDCEDYQKLTKYSDEQMVMQIRINMDAELKRAIDTNYINEWDAFTLKQAVAKIGEIVNHISNPAVYRKQFDEMKQKDNESIREYITRLRSCALDCNFVCPHNEMHDLSDYHIMNRIRSGVYDNTLQQELLQKAESLSTLMSITQYCENYETARKDKMFLSQNESLDVSLCGVETDGLSHSDIVAAISTYKKYKRDKDKPKDKKCGYCGHDQHAVKNSCPAFGKTCNKCGKNNHFENVCRSSNSVTNKHVSSVIIGTIVKIINASYYLEKLPKLSIIFNVKMGTKKIDCIADTGAQVNVAGLQQMKELGISQDQLAEPPHMLQHAGGSPLNVLGSYHTQVEHNSRIMDIEIYFASEVKNLYLSLDTCKKLMLVHEDFPNVSINNVEKGNKEDVSVFPNKPLEPPFPATEENVSRLEQWLLNEFSSTTFNTTRYPLPLMSGKEHHIHIESNVKPVAANTPIPIPHNWKDEVKRQLDEEEKMGIIRKAPVGEITEWCSRMVTVTKKDGSPRRTIDFQQLNKYCKREPHHTPTPFEVVSHVPTKTYKTVLDAYNGYHQVPLDEESIKLTTFITEFGRYQCLRSPQGHKSSGDAYTRRYDDIICDVPRKEKIIDDTLLHQDTIKNAFFHTFDYLLLCARNGITLNPTKFKFACKEVHFAGYNIGWETYHPSKELIAAIEDFPMPENPNISDIRAWFGVVNQISPFTATAPLMDPFRELLKHPKSGGKKVFWDFNLQKTFEDTKLLIIQQSIEGLKYYDKSKPTAVVTDWSKQGIAFVVIQKHCSCENDDTNPLCCGGWKLVFCNSRFLTAAEKNYAPIEGEALAVAWALKKARMFLLGGDFKVIVDHKPLLRISNDRSLADISNIRLLTLKEKILEYRFSIHYVKGINNMANTFSRYPVSTPDANDLKSSNTIEVAAINIQSNLERSASITHKTLQEAIAHDSQYQTVLSAVRDNTFAATLSLEVPDLREFHNIKDGLSIINNTLMYGSNEKQQRLVIPRKLRKQAIINLHAANQGATQMLARARQVIYWPGMDRDINNHVSSCNVCRKISPSLQKEPLIHSPIAEYPFQYTVSDLFEIEGHTYLVYIDRLTGFPELAHIPNPVTSTTIINTYREFFHRWGVPEQISLDGGPNLASKEMVNWLNEWGVHQRVSSAYYPQSNGRAAAGVKSLKRLLLGNTDRRGTLNTDQVAHALSQYRNTPLRGINKSPAQLALGRQIRDTIPLPRSRYKISNEWRHSLKEREIIMSKSNKIIKTKYDVGSKPLPELKIGSPVLCQNARNLKWDRSGIVVTVAKNRQYYVKMDGSQRLTLRNRRHLRPILVNKPVVPMLHPTVQNDTTNKVDRVENDLGNQTVSTDNNITLNAPSIDADKSIDNEPSATNRPVNITLRRSARTSKKPIRHRDEES